MQSFDAPIVVLSYALGGHEPRSVVAAVHNGLEFTSASTQVIVHVSNATHAVSDSKRQASKPKLRLAIGARERVVRALSTLDRVWLNPRALATAKATPAVLAAHLSNFAVCVEEHPRAPCGHAESRFVLLAANNVLFRPGLERVVHAGSLSFCVGNKCADPPGLSRDDLTRLAWRGTRDGTRDGDGNGGGDGGGGSASPLRDEVLSAVARGDDFEVANDAYIAAFSFFVRGGHAGPKWSRDGPVNFHPHEGAYYPVWMMREVLRAASESPFGEAMRAQQAHASPLASPHKGYCTCCELYEPVVMVHRDDATKAREKREAKNGQRVCAGSSGSRRNRSWWPVEERGDRMSSRCPKRPRPWFGLARDSVHGRGACFLEELLLPTYVWQHHAPLLVNATPPLVMRLKPSAFAEDPKLAANTPEATATAHGTTRSRPPEDLSALRDLASFVSSAPGFEHVVALKVCQRDFLQTACAIFDDASTRPQSLQAACANLPDSSLPTHELSSPAIPASTTADPVDGSSPSSSTETWSGLFEVPSSQTTLRDDHPFAAQPHPRPAATPPEQPKLEEPSPPVTQSSREERQAAFEALMARRGTRFSGQATAEDVATPDTSDAGGNAAPSGHAEGRSCHALHSLSPHIEGYNIAPITAPRSVDSVFAIGKGGRLSPPKPLVGAPVAKVRGLFNSGTSWVSNQLKALGFRLAGEEGLKPVSPPVKNTAGSTPNMIPNYPNTNIAPSGLYGCWKHTPPWLLMGVYDIPEYLAPTFVTVAVVRHPLHWLASQLHKSYDIECDDALLGLNCSFGPIHHGDPYSGNLKFCPGPMRDRTVYPTLEDLWVRYVRGYRAYGREEGLPWLHRRRVLLVRHEDFVVQSPAEMRSTLLAGLVAGHLPKARSSMAKRETPLVSAQRSRDSYSTRVDKAKGVLPVEAAVLASLVNSSSIRSRLHPAVLERVARNAELRAVAGSLGYELLPC